ncbi:hypothetical protein ACH40F_52685 [Streptomyces sp. NPDC020794]|uniref:hypothetical protein n=1 Tax=unclassified Streptomyces TaxID=2593676 RepID=UPI0036E5999A
MRGMTTMSEPVQLGLPEAEPVPVDECDVCSVLARNRKLARREGDLSKVSDLNVEMRSHQAAKR